jgi:GNAT superfamily N-acetyltransferase
MSCVEPKLCPQARQSTDADMNEIRRWVEQPEPHKVHCTFLSNWNATLRLHQRGQLLVYIDGVTGSPVAYQRGGLLQPGILHVRHDMRGRGIGKALVAHRLQEAFQAGEDILHIECTPSTSIPFWKRMGFELRRGDDDKNWALRYMRRTLELPKGGKPVRVLVEWFPEAQRWEPATRPVRTLHITGVLVDDEDVYLAERALCCEEEVEGAVVLRVRVDGQEWYCGKATSAAAEELGVQRCLNGFFLDMLFRPEQNGS